MNEARKVLKNFGFLTSGRILGDLFAFLLFVVLSRVYGQGGIGQYSFAMAFTGFFAVFADFGLYHLAVKELSRLNANVGRSYSPMLLLRLILSVAVTAALFLVIPFLPFPVESKLIIAIIGVYLVMQRLMGGATAAFLARHDSHLAGGLEAVMKIAAALAVMMIVAAGGSLALALVALPVVGAMLVLIAYALLIAKYGRPRWRGASSQLGETLRAAAPYGLSRLFWQIYMRADVVLIGFMVSEAASGVYNVALRIVVLLMLVPQLTSMALFPLASRLYLNARQRVHELYDRSLGLVVLIALPTAMGVWLIAPQLIPLLFGDTFSESVIILQILSIVLLLNFVSALLDMFMMSCDLQVERTRRQAIVATANVMGNLILIPLLGIKGAAITTVFSEGLLVALFVIRLRPVLGWPRITSRLLIGAIGAAALWIPFTLLPTLSLFFVIPLCGLLYLCILLMFPDIRQHELRLVVSLLKRDSTLPPDDQASSATP